MKMRNIKNILGLTLICIIFSCEKVKITRTVTCTQGSYYEYLDGYKIDSLCTDSICVYYQNLWKDLFMEQNNLSKSYFENNIELCQSSINNWAQGTSFRICYKVKIDWIIAYECDQFIIKIDKESNWFPSFIRDTYLQKNDIKNAIETHAFSSDIVKLSNIDTVQFDSFQNALEFLTKKADVNKLCSRRIYIDESTGNILLEAWGEYFNEYNSCIKGRLDLITGDTYITDTNCFIIN